MNIFIQRMYNICKSILMLYTLKQHTINWTHVTIILESKFFDANYYKSVSGLYLSTNNLALHYLYLGYKQGINPSMLFCGDAYTTHYTDVKNTKMCPLLHYELYGKKEGRIAISLKDLYDNTISESDYSYIDGENKDRKKILLISHEFSLTGAPRALLNLAITLKSMDVSVVMWSMLPGDLQKEVEEQGIPYKICTLLFTYINGDNKIYSDFTNYVSHFDLVIFNTIVVLSKVEYFKNIHIKKACWIHDGSYGFQCCPDTPKFQYQYKLYDAIFAVGDYTKRMIHAYINNDVAVTNLIYGIDDVANTPDEISLNAKCVTMVLAGTIDRRKGQDILLQSLQFLPSDILKQLKIYIIGGCADENILTALCEDKTGCISVLGSIEHDKLLKIFNQMDILLCPSIDDPMPIVCTEAMMLSKPIIVSNNTGTVSFIKDGENGFIIQAEDPHSLADAIRKAVLAKEQLGRIGRNAKVIFENHFTNEIFRDSVRRCILPLL